MFIFSNFTEIESIFFILEIQELLHVFFYMKPVYKKLEAGAP